MAAPYKKCGPGLTCPSGYHCEGGFLVSNRCHPNDAAYWWERIKDTALGLAILAVPVALGGGVLYFLLRPKKEPTLQGLRRRRRRRR